MQALRIVVGGRILDESSDDSTWEGGGDTTVLEQPGRGGWDMDFKNYFPGEGRPAELPGGRMPGTSGDEDDNVRVLTAPACP